MKRIQDKIKDLVEPQSFEQVGNFAEDPAQALAAYRFTDVTSDLLSRWLDVLASLPPGGGASHALAGPRGVGKSHTLAVFGALAGSERLRATVEDGHVTASAARLTGRRFAVVRVERGTRPTLAEELGTAFARLFGGSESQWVRTPAETLAVAASRAAGETLLVVVDTAFNRPARVARDDGPALAALADAARDLNVFLALALDDDIAGADGANVAVAGAYRIEYLDPENLYRVADQYVLRKKPQVGDTLREIYQSLRATVHEFNWSQARFSSVYPVHPLVAEVASGVRLYVSNFAFLPFAAAAAARATSRPALSLVLLDEVFDAAEAGLREAPELRRAFAAYDHLTERCIARLPIMQRYQARLILKSLFVLSLDGRDVTPGEMCAALLLTDGETGDDAPRRAGEILSRFASESAPGSLILAAGPGGETRYRFHIAALDAIAPQPHASAQPAQQPAQANAESAADDEGLDRSFVESARVAENATVAGSSHASAAPADSIASAEQKSGQPAEVVQPAQSNQETQASAGANEGREAERRAEAEAEAEAAAERVEAKADGAQAEVKGGDAQVKVGGDEAGAVGSGEARLEGRGREVKLEDGSGDTRPESRSEGQKVKDGSRGARAGRENLEAHALPERSVEWARLLTFKPALGTIAGRDVREEVSAALAAWLGRWRAGGLQQKFDALPDGCLTTRVWKAEAEVRKSFGRSASAVSDALDGKISFEDALARVAEAFKNSSEVFERRARLLEDLTEFVEGFAERERVRAYLATAEATGVGEAETARRELLTLAEDPNNFLDPASRDRFRLLWQEFSARYSEHYAAVHDKTVGAREARESLQTLRRGERWREFESLSRLPVVSTQVWRQAEALLRRADNGRCDLPVRKLLEGRPSCACHFRLSQAAEQEDLPQELEALMEWGLAVYRRTLLMIGANLAISLDALARRDADEETARRARTLSTAFAQSRVPERLARQDVELIERALKRMPSPPPVKVVAPNGDAGLLTREELRSRFEQWLDELPERPVLIEVVSKAEINAP
ncbi:MAG TPA: DUF6079 family protein [Pyrinomonadaceae bacterium]|nr:DUF6079 family protein [Pyrinomonadaceae bacterium]